MKASIKLKRDGNYKVMTIEGIEEATDYVTTVNIPTSVMKMNIPLSCKLIAGFIFSFNFNSKKFFATNNFIATSLNISRHTVKNSLSILEKNNIIFRKYGKEKNKNERVTYFNFNIMSQHEETELPDKEVCTESVPTPVQKVYHQPGTESVPHVLNTLTKQITKQIPKGITAKAGNPDINEIISYLEEKRTKTLDGTIRDNRNFAHLLINKIKKDYPDKEPVKAIKALIDIGLLDEFHSRNLTNIKYLYYNTQKLISSYQSNRMTIAVI